MLPECAPEAVYDLRATFSGHLLSAREMVKEQLDIFWLPPFAVDLFFLVDHKIMDDSTYLAGQSV